jgi:hypothetical protein
MPEPTQYDKDQFFQALKLQLPSLKSQAQFNTFQAAFEAFRAVMNAIFADLPPVEKAGREALEQAFEAARMATRLTHQLTEVPEAATSKLADEFKQPPAEFSEYDEQRRLLSELEQLKTLQELTVWWNTVRTRIDRVKSPMLRNPLIDACREKRSLFQQPITKAD